MSPFLNKKPNKSLYKSDFRTSLFSRLGLVVASLCVVLFAPAAQAGLGEPVASIATDIKAIHGHAQTVTPRDTYDVHESLLDDGTKVRQFASHAGTVFAVSWSGRSMPDLGVLLGSHYTDYVKATKARPKIGNHHVMTVSTPDIQISVIKFLRSSSGSAYLPASLPAGTTPQALH